jgi:acetyl-CoA carboxylase carboxyltransferase component
MRAVADTNVVISGLLWNGPSRAVLDRAHPRYAAVRLWVDAIIDPAEPREVLARSLACVAMNPEVPEFRTGVLQT